MDLVANIPTSINGFRIQKLSKQPKRDYYIWKDPVNGSVPNNWKAFFSGSTWELDAQTDNIIAFFVKEQPDLNWENPEVRKVSMRS